MLVFYHNITGGYFDPSSQAISCNEPNKYSILNKISDVHRDEDNKFIFLMIYEEQKQYNSWQQSNNPIYEKPTQSNNNFYEVPGYNKIEIRAGKSSFNCKWGGLLLSSSPDGSYLDGCPGGKDWFYSIGYTGLPWSTSKYTKIPSNAEPGVKSVSLWVKILNTKAFVIDSCKINYNIANNCKICYAFLLILLDLSE